MGQHPKSTGDETDTGGSVELPPQVDFVPAEPDRTGGGSIGYKIGSFGVRHTTHTDPDTAHTPVSPSARREASEDDLDRAEVTFRQLRTQLESEHFDRYVAIDVDDGRYVVADTRRGAQAAHMATFGDERHSCTFHIGTSE
jgi:hypothetical protein